MFNLNPGPALAGAAALFAAGALAATFTPLVGANARVDRARASVEGLKADVRAWKRSQADTAAVAVAWARARGESEALRKAETRRAINAVSADAAACDARIATARRSAAALSALIHKEPTRDAHGCPVRQLLDPRQLRDALRPPPAG